MPKKELIKMCLVCFTMVFSTASARSQSVSIKDRACERFVQALELRSDISYTKQQAQTFATNLSRNYRLWYKYLPCCPTAENEIRNNSFWKRDANPCLEYMHIGAASCYRSVQIYYSTNFETDPAAANHGQQCCYDKYGELLVRGPGAGTPDFFSPASELSHFETDVAPWFKLSLVEYQATWVPNQGCGQPFRRIMAGNQWNYVLDVRKGDIVRIYDARGTVTWGLFGSSSGPEGSANVAETDVGYLLAPPLLPEEKTGALIGMVYKKSDLALDEDIFPRYMTTPFFIGKENTVEILEDGKLLLAVNDGNLSNNSGTSTWKFIVKGAQPQDAD